MMVTVRQPQGQTALPPRPSTSHVKVGVGVLLDYLGDVLGTFLAATTSPQRALAPAVSRTTPFHPRGCDVPVFLTRSVTVDDGHTLVSSDVSGIVDAAAAGIPTTRDVRFLVAGPPAVEHSVLFVSANI